MSRPVRAIVGALAFLCSSAAAAAQSPADPSLPPLPPIRLQDSLALLAPSVRHPIDMPAACPVPELWAHMEWQWRRRSRTMLADLWKLSEGREPEALAKLKSQERREPGAAAMYQACHDASPRAFWHLVLTASSAQSGDFERCRRGLEWQRGTRRASLRNSAEWARGEGNRHAPAALIREIAIVALLEGQWHNPRAMAQYRACYRDAPDSLWKFIETEGR